MEIADNNQRSASAFIDAPLDRFILCIGDPLSGTYFIDDEEWFLTNPGPEVFRIDHFRTMRRQIRQLTLLRLYDCRTQLCYCEVLTARIVDQA